MWKPNGIEHLTVQLNALQSIANTEHVKYKNTSQAALEEKGYSIHIDAMWSLVSFYNTATCKQSLKVLTDHLKEKDFTNRMKHWYEVIYRSNHLFKAQFFLHL